MITFHILSLFPESIRPYADESILSRAQKAKKIRFNFVHLRDFTAGAHRTADDSPYGGGPGMVLKPEPILEAVQSLKLTSAKKKILIMAAGGKAFDAKMAKQLAREKDIVLIAGRYEGIDARVKRILRAEEISIGPYVLSGGELPAMVVAEAVARHIPGVLGRAESLEERRHGAGVPVYTRPESLAWKGKTYRVPAVLLSGDHAKIDAWRKDRQASLRPAIP